VSGSGSCRRTMTEMMGENSNVETYRPKNTKSNWALDGKGLKGFTDEKRDS